MLLTKEVELFISSGNINYLKNLGYTHIHRNEKIIIPIEHLSKGSGKVVSVKCDICEREKEITYAKYIINIKSTGIYCCSEKCGLFKHEKTCLERYGQKNYSKTKDCHNKKKETCLKKYGTENVFQSEIIKTQIKKSNIKNYGVEFVSQLDWVKEKTKNTNLKRYGVKSAIQNSEVFLKQQKSSHKTKFHKQTELYYQGSYEKHFLDFCFINNIKIKRGKNIKYFLDKERVYFSDFYLEESNLIIEIKSYYTLKRDLKENFAKRRATLKSGYNYIFIIDKNYNEFNNLIEKRF